jgi:hypothetical protein
MGGRERPGGLGEMASSTHARAPSRVQNGKDDLKVDVVTVF